MTVAPSKRTLKNLEKFVVPNWYVSGMTKEIIINAPEGTNIDGLQIEQTISQPADLEIGPVKVGDSDVLTSE